MGIPVKAVVTFRGSGTAAAIALRAACSGIPSTRIKTKQSTTGSSLIHLIWFAAVVGKKAVNSRVMAGDVPFC